MDNTINENVIIIPEEYQKLENQFIKLKNMPQYEQRTHEWYAYRKDRITASDTAAAIDMNPYEPVESFIYKKCVPSSIFEDNDTVFFGRKYEQVALTLYKFIYNTNVEEFGAIPSEKYLILGASPDGICSSSTLNNIFSPRIGTMIEIKCPVTRKIETEGSEICPFYYYCQVQQQLECCDLDVCDFFQCKISEYKSKEDFLKDNCNNCESSETENDIKKNLIINNNYKKGVIIEYYPNTFIKKYDNEKIEWSSKYLYPTNINLTEDEYDKYIIENKDKEIFPGYSFNKIIYYKIQKCHNYPIKRNNIFIQNIIPILNDTWQKVLYYRHNKNKLSELEIIINERKNKKMYLKNTMINTSNNIFISNKIKFLDNKKNKINKIDETDLLYFGD